MRYKIILMSSFFNVWLLVSINLFSQTELLPPTLISPSDNQALSTITPTFRWNSTLLKLNTLENTIENTVSYELNLNGMTFYVNTTEYTIPMEYALMDGPYSWKVRAIDGQGNYGEWSETRNFYIDTIPPLTPQLIIPQDFTVINNLNFVWNRVSDISGVLYNVFIDGLFMLQTETTNCLLNTSLYEDLHCWYITPMDKAGNEGQATLPRYFFLDMTPPEPVTLIQPEQNMIFSTTQPVFEWSESWDIYGLNYYEVEIDGLIKRVNETSYAAETSFEEGYHSWRVRAVDTTGNMNLWTESRSFIIDLSPPEITIMGIEQGKYYNTDVVPIIQIQDLNLKSSYITLNNNPFTSGTVLSEERDYILEVGAEDQVNNNAITTIEFGIDRTVPVIIINGVVQGETYSDQVKIDIEIIEAHPAIGTTNLLYFTGTSNMAIPFTSGMSLSNEGQYQLTVSCQDSAGNSTTQSVNFTIESINPDKALTFKAEYNQKTRADKAAGDDKDYAHGKITWWHQGQDGEALTSFPWSFSQGACYKADKNINEAEGTLMLWVKPFWKTANFTHYDQGRSIFSLYKKYGLCHTSINFVVYKNKGTTAQIRCLDNDKQNYMIMLSVDTNRNESQRWYKDGPATWTHLTLSWNSLKGVIKIYLNGELAGTKQVNPWQPYKVGKQGWFKVGDGNQFWFNEFMGFLDRVKIYENTLSDHQVKNLYEQEKTIGPCLEKISLSK